MYLLHKIKKRPKKSISRGKIKQVTSSFEEYSITNSKNMLSKCKDELLNEEYLDKFLTYSCNRTIFNNCESFTFNSFIYDLEGIDKVLKKREILFSRGYRW